MGRRDFQLTAELVLTGPTNLGPIAKKLALFRIPASSIQSVNQFASGITGINAAVSKTRTNVQALSKSLTKAQSGLKQSSVNLSKMRGSALQAISGWENFGRTVGFVTTRLIGFRIASAVVIGFGGAIKNAVGEAVDFERQLARIAQVTGKNIDQLTRLSSEITRLSVNLGVSSKDLVGISRTLAQTGLSANDVRIALEALAKSTLLPTFGNIESTVEGSIAILRQFNLQAKDLNGVLSSINAVAGSFAVEAEDVVQAVKKAGGVFSALSSNVGSGEEAFRQFLATFASVRATTRESAQNIATGLRTIFTRIQRPKTIKFLKQFGIELEQAGKFVGPFEALNRLSDALAKLDPRSLQVGQIVEQLAGTRQIAKVLPLLFQAELRQKALQVATEGQTSSDEQLGKALDTLAVKAAKVREEFKAFIREVVATDTFQGIAKAVLIATSSMIKFADALKPIIPFLALLTAVKSISIGAQLGKGLATGALYNPRGAGPPSTAAVGGVSASGQAAANRASEKLLITAINANTVAIQNLTLAMQRTGPGGQMVYGLGSYRTKARAGQQLPPLLPGGRGGGSQTNQATTASTRGLAGSVAAITGVIAAGTVASIGRRSLQDQLQLRSNVRGPINRALPGTVGAVEGATGGALTGGFIGSFAGAPIIGAAIGALIGGITGLVTSLKDFDKQIKEISLNEALEDFDTAITRFNRSNDLSDLAAAQVEFRRSFDAAAKNAPDVIGTGFAVKALIGKDVGEDFFNALVQKLSLIRTEFRNSDVSGKARSLISNQISRGSSIEQLLQSNPKVFEAIGRAEATDEQLVDIVASGKDVSGEFRKLGFAIVKIDDKALKLARSLDVFSTGIESLGSIFNKTIAQIQAVVDVAGQQNLLNAQNALTRAGGASTVGGVFQRNVFSNLSGFSQRDVNKDLKSFGVGGVIASGVRTQQIVETILPKIFEQAISFDDTSKAQTYLKNEIERLFGGTALANVIDKALSESLDADNLLSVDQLRTVLDKVTKVNQKSVEIADKFASETIDNNKRLLDAQNQRIALEIQDITSRRDLQKQQIQQFRALREEAGLKNALPAPTNVQALIAGRANIQGAIGARQRGILQSGGGAAGLAKDPVLAQLVIALGANRDALVRAADVNDQLAEVNKVLKDLEEKRVKAIERQTAASNSIIDVFSATREERRKELRERFAFEQLRQTGRFSSNEGIARLQAAGAKRVQSDLQERGDKERAAALGNVVGAAGLRTAGFEGAARALAQPIPKNVAQMPAGQKALAQGKGLIDQSAQAQLQLLREQAQETRTFISEQVRAFNAVNEGLQKTMSPFVDSVDRLSTVLESDINITIGEFPPLQVNIAGENIIAQAITKQIGELVSNEIRKGMAGMTDATRLPGGTK